METNNSKVALESQEKGGFRFVSKLKITDPGELDTLAKVYLAAFEEINSATPCLQSYTEDEIKEALEDEENIKYILYHKQEIVGFGLAASNFEKVPWVNSRYYYIQFKEQAERGLLFYFKGLVITPEFQNTEVECAPGEVQKLAVVLFNFMTRSFPVGAMICFDCSEKVNFWLCSKIFSSMGCFEYPAGNDGKSFFDRQIYHAIEKTTEPKKIF